MEPSAMDWRGIGVKVAVIVLADPHVSPRPKHLIRHLDGAGHEVVTMGHRNADFTLPPLWRPHIALAAMLFALRQYRRLIGSKIPPSAAGWLQDERPDIVVLHDLKLLPWLATVPGDWRVVVDLQEYYPDMLASMRWRLTMGAMYRWILKRYGHLVTTSWTVSRGLQRLYRENHGIDPLFVPNAPPHEELTSEPYKDGQTLLLVHHGFALPDRGIEEMIGAMRHVRRDARLDLVLLQEPAFKGYFGRIRRLVEQSPNVRLVEPGPVDAIVSSKARYHGGLYVLPLDNENMANALPNKFFDFLQARLCIITGPGGEMSELAQELGVGVKSATYDPRAIAAAIDGMDAQTINTCKKNAADLAFRWSYEGACVPAIDASLQAIMQTSA